MRPVSSLIYYQAFEEKPLESTIKFDEVSENRVTMITSKGQIVFWKGSNVTVYELDSEGREQTRKLVGMPDGQGVVQDSTKLYITQGKVIDGERG